MTDDWRLVILGAFTWAMLAILVVVTPIIVRKWRNQKDDAMNALPYVYRWNRQGRKGQTCEVIARGTMNSCCVRFADGYTMVTSRNALAKVKEVH